MLCSSGKIIITIINQCLTGTLKCLWFFFFKFRVPKDLKDIFLRPMRASKRKTKHIKSISKAYFLIHHNLKKAGIISLLVLVFLIWWTTLLLLIFSEKKKFYKHCLACNYFYVIILFWFAIFEVNFLKVYTKMFCFFIEICILSLNWIFTMHKSHYQALLRTEAWERSTVVRIAKFSMELCFLVL